MSAAFTKDSLNLTAMSLALTSSSESSTAPMDFNVCHSMENSLQSPPAHRCHMCRQMRRTFTCADCVRAGEITHSKPPYKGTFCFKKLQLSQYEREKHKCATLIEEASKISRQRDEFMQRIELTKQRLSAANIVLRRFESDIVNAYKEMRLIKHACVKTREKRNSLHDRKKLCINETEKIRKSIMDKRDKLQSMRDTISDHVGDHVQDLRLSIFPIGEKKAATEEKKPRGKLADLEEACCTNYIRGKWVYSNHSVNAVYSIVEPCLPADGNYNQLIEWVQQNQDQNAISRDDNHKHAFEVAAGLMHLTQLVKMLAFFLDLRLPYVMCFSEFAPESLSEDGLANILARLNGNVVFLCASQNVDPAQIKTKQTVRNILNLFELPEFTKKSSFEMSAELTYSVEETLTRHLCLFDAHAELDMVSDTRSDALDSDEDCGEWESVNTSSLPSPAAIDQSYAYSTTVSLMGRQRTTSESLLSSICNMWWSATSQK